MSTAVAELGAFWDGFKQQLTPVFIKTERAVPTTRTDSNNIISLLHALQAEHKNVALEGLTYDVPVIWINSDKEPYVSTLSLFLAYQIQRTGACPRQSPARIWSLFQMMVSGFPFWISMERSFGRLVTPWTEMSHVVFVSTGREGYGHVISAKKKFLVTLSKDGLWMK